MNAVKNENICKWICVQKQVKVEKHKNGICAFGNAPRYLQGLENARKIRMNVKNGLRKRSVDIVMSKRSLKLFSGCKRRKEILTTRPRVVKSRRRSRETEVLANDGIQSVNIGSAARKSAAG